MFSNIKQLRQTTTKNLLRTIPLEMADYDMRILVLSQFDESLLLAP